VGGDKQTAGQLTACQYSNTTLLSDTYPCPRRSGRLFPLSPPPRTPFMALSPPPSCSQPSTGWLFRPPFTSLSFPFHYFLPSHSAAAGETLSPLSHAASS